MSITKEIDVLIRARYPLLYIVSYEEERVKRTLIQTAQAQGKNILEWTCTDGIRLIEDFHSPQEIQKPMRRPLEVLNAILQYDVPSIYILKDFHAYLENPTIVRQLRDMNIALEKTYKTIVILSPLMKIPPELEKSLTVIDFPPPDIRTLAKLLKDITAKMRRSQKIKVTLTGEDRENLVKAVQGLTIEEAIRVFHQAVVDDATFDRTDIPAVLSYKKQIIRKSGLLEYYTAEENMNDIGGLELLKKWLEKRGKAFSEKARKYGLPQPKGVLILGVQGCGKSLTAKSASQFWGMPLLRLDMSKIFTSYIGQSEHHMTKAIKVAEAISPAVLWIDEIEKAFSGIDSSSRTDAGTTARVFGTFLTWLQENKSYVFVIATANSIENLPPELLRKGRFDEIFFVDLPNTEEREEIFKIHIAKRKRNPEDFDLKELAKKTKNFSGAEIEEAIVSALYDAFYEDREVKTEDIIANIERTVPLSVTMKEKIDYIRDWAENRARPASTKS